MRNRCIDELDIARKNARSINYFSLSLSLLLIILTIDSKTKNVAGSKDIRMQPCLSKLPLL